MKKTNLSFKRVKKNFADIALPHYATEGSSGMDVRATTEQPIIIESGKVILVPTNIAVEIPLGYEIQVRPRSGLAAKNGIGLLNSPGTIDADYRGEIKIIMFNFSDTDFTINNGDRIAQLVLAEVIIADIVEVDELGSTARGAGGFGHTGKR
ncbi:MAG: dUTP diphosphatase [Melioribacteraceae bacterium]